MNQKPIVSAVAETDRHVRDAGPVDPLAPIDSFDVLSAYGFAAMTGHVTQFEPDPGRCVGPVEGCKRIATTLLSGAPSVVAYWKTVTLARGPSWLTGEEHRRHAPRSTQDGSGPFRDPACAG